MEKRKQRQLTDFCVSLFVLREAIVVRGAVVATVHVTSLRKRCHFLVIESANLRSQKFVNQHDGSAESEQNIHEFREALDIVRADMHNLNDSAKHNETRQHTTNRRLILHQRTR